MSVGRYFFGRKRDHGNLLWYWCAAAISFLLASMRGNTQKCERKTKRARWWRADSSLATMPLALKLSGENRQ